MSETKIYYQKTLIRENNIKKDSIPSLHDTELIYKQEIILALLTHQHLE